MSSVVSFEVARELRARSVPVSASIEIALLGCGNVGSALAALVQRPHRPAPSVRIATALVRDARRPRPTLSGDALRTSDAAAALGTAPDVVVEVLGGLEPARTIVHDALHRGIPVVTANKSLLAAHGRELRELAASTSTPFLYEAAVIAGVPFLGTFARRPYAAQLTSVVGIANGTSNYILTRASSERCAIGIALADAQRLGLAEPDPVNDIDGIDACEKLVVLLQHFAGADVTTAGIETRGIRDLTSIDIERARELGGTIKPIISADWSDGVTAFVGPAFVPAEHPLAAVDSVENAVLFGGPRGRILFRGPGAGPEVTAATVLDDVYEAWGEATRRVPAPLQHACATAPESGWLISLRGERLPRGVEIADLLASHGVYLRCTGARHSREGVESVGGLTWAAGRPRIEHALRALERATGGRTSLIRAIGD